MEEAARASAPGGIGEISNTLAELSAASATLGKTPYPRPAANLSDIVRIMTTCDSHLIEHARLGVNG